MYFSKETLATNSRLGGHWSELWANRNMWNLQRQRGRSSVIAFRSLGNFSKKAASCGEASRVMTTSSINPSSLTASMTLSVSSVSIDAPV